MQYVLWWAALVARIPGLLERKVTRLAGILAARQYPVERLARSLELAAEVVERASSAGTSEVVGALRRNARALRRPKRHRPARRWS